MYFVLLLNIYRHYPFRMRWITSSVGCGQNFWTQTVAYSRRTIAIGYATFQSPTQLMP